MNLIANLKTKADKVAMGVNMAALAAVTSVTAYAAANPWGSAEAAISNVAGQLGASLQTIATPVAIAAMIYCFIMMMCSKDQKKVEAHRGWLITIALCVVGIYAVPFILELAQNIGKSF